ncbi:oxidase [Acrocarpospora corrugata]|uniref:Oxidase n=1 Tax=Acrocarpospora corrugata TaxID=35763 RepID=A0A5M3VVA5_9ACTN|nr:FAD/NAD(P)-binding oxidoreductase [Acrocarpospora corrugata]GES00725.1 oxidase [Acrocarpospora corrugata]
MKYDLIVIGAGPAGMAAAGTAARGGLRVALVDSAAQLGGQFHRQPPPELGGGNVRDDPTHERLGRDQSIEQAIQAPAPRRDFLRLRDRLTGVDLHLGCRVWAVEPSFAVHHDGGTLTGERLLIATGAHDRVVPFPGWDLPGVMTAGGAQALLKGNLVVAGRRIAVAGTGPFLLPVAAGLAAAGARVVGVFEAARQMGALARYPAKLAEGAGYAATLARYRVPYHRGQAVVAAHGADELAKVTVAKIDDGWRAIRTREIECDALAVGYGFVPQLDLPVQLGCATTRDSDGSAIVAVDDQMRTSITGVHAAGETTGVGGAELAELDGIIAGHSITGTPLPDGVRRRRERARAFARLLHEVFPVRDGWRDRLRADTIVCRCEEVPYQAICDAQALGAVDTRSLKLLARPGMGWCQGRMCGYAVARLAGEDPPPPRRPIAQPISLQNLAAYPLRSTNDDA